MHHVARVRRSGALLRLDRREAAVDRLDALPHPLLAAQGEQEARFKQRPEAWDFFQAQAPSYRKAALWWVVSAKRAETRERRLATLIEDSAGGRSVKPLTRPGKK